ncbi:MAG: protein kinase [Muribaculaceae bacterium]|nr:protein kinase [Muribaculaceae bacterium]
MAAFLTDYTRLDEIGRGAFARVYKVRHNQLGYIRAIRVLNDTIAMGEDDPVWHKFLNECRLLLRLGNGNNPHIVHIYQPLLRDCKALVEMDYIDGKDLKDYLDSCNRFVEADEVLRMAREIGGALAYCHHDIYRSCMDRDEDHLQDDPDDGSQVLIDAYKEAELVRKYQVIHNDLHSGNIMRRTDGMYVLLDFGLSIQDGDVLHSSKRRGGAPEYKAPEKWDDDGIITTQTDVFSFGVILYEMLTGHVPFQFQKGVAEVEAEYNLMKAIKNEPVPPVMEMRRRTFEATHPGENYVMDYPKWMETFIMRCLEKDPTQRFADGREMFDTFEELAASEVDDSNKYSYEVYTLKQEIKRLKQQIHSTGGSFVATEQYYRKQIDELKYQNEQLNEQLRQRPATAGNASELQQKVAFLTDQLESINERFVATEQYYQRKLSELKEENQRLRDPDKTDDKGSKKGCTVMGCLWLFIVIAVLVYAALSFVNGGSISWHEFCSYIKELLNLLPIYNGRIS